MGYLSTMACGKHVNKTAKTIRIICFIRNYLHLATDREKVGC